MRVIGATELELIVRRTFPAKGQFSVHTDLGLTLGRLPAITFVHGGGQIHSSIAKSMHGWKARPRTFSYTRC